MGAGKSITVPKQSKKTIGIQPIDGNEGRYVVDFKSLFIDFLGLLWLMKPLELSIEESKCKGPKCKSAKQSPIKN